VPFPVSKLVGQFSPSASRADLDGSHNPSAGSEAIAFSIGMLAAAEAQSCGDAVVAHSRV